MAETFGDRVVSIRQARGGGPRTAVKQPAMAELLGQLAGIDVDGSRLSRIESGKELKFYEALAILRALKQLDPEGRSYDWLIGSEPLPLKKVEPKKLKTPARGAKVAPAVPAPRVEKTVRRAREG